MTSAGRVPPGAGMQSGQVVGDLGAAARRPRPAGAETKPSFKTTEFFVFLAVVIAIVVTALTVDGDPSTGGDPFSAEHALRYITFLAIGYMVSRGLAKAGSRQAADDNR